MKCVRTTDFCLRLFKMQHTTQRAVIRTVSKTTPPPTHIPIRAPVESGSDLWQSRDNHVIHHLTPDNECTHDYANNGHSKQRASYYNESKARVRESSGHQCTWRTNKNSAIQTMGGLASKGDRLIKGCTWIFHYILWCHATWTHESDWSSPVPFLLPFSPNPDIWEQINIACKLTPFHFIIHITHRQPDMYIIYIFIYILYTHRVKRKGL